MENETLFLIQYNSMGSSSRGKMSGGVALRLEDLYDKEFMKKVLTGHYNLMYAYPRCSYNNIIHMSKDGFEKVFKDSIEKVRYLITEYKIFRKEIFDAYSGIEKEVYKLIRKPIQGHLYLDEAKNKWLYVGNVNLAGEIDNKEFINESGNLYIPVYEEINSELFLQKIVSIVRRQEKKPFLKGHKKLIEDLGDSGINLESLSEYTTRLPKCVIYSYERDLKYKITWR